MLTMRGLLSYRQGKLFSCCSSLPQSRHILCHIQGGNFFLQFLLLYGSQILQCWEDVIRRITIQKILITRQATSRGQLKLQTGIDLQVPAYIIWFEKPNLYSTKPVLEHSSLFFTCHAERKKHKWYKKRGSCERLVQLSQQIYHPL